ncbi:MAG TPA: PAS domain S-box protein, partial [Terracidiphilus sp.]|nr:PAS domain S-box protein [Terracidiphilus sp.]
MSLERSSRRRNPIPAFHSRLGSAPQFQCEDERNSLCPDAAGLTTAPFLCRLAAIVRSSNDAIISKSLDGTIQTWNEGAERVYGYSARGAIGQSIAILDPDGECGSHAAILDAVRSGREVR